MYLITKKKLAIDAAKRYRKQYEFRTELLYDGRDPQKIIQQLESLGDKVTAKQVDEITGNGSWTENKCGECGKDSPALVEIGQEYDYESRTAFICKKCLMKALKLFQ